MAFDLDEDELEATRKLNGVDGMSEEEIIQKLWDIATTSTFETKDYPNRVVMKTDLLTLLKAYEQEKEKNKKLENEAVVLRMTHDYDVKMIDDVKGDAVELYKVIDLMAEFIVKQDIDEDICRQFKMKEDCYADTADDNNACKDCIKEYYFKKARENKS